MTTIPLATFQNVFSVPTLTKDTVKQESVKQSKFADGLKKKLFSAMATELAAELKAETPIVDEDDQVKKLFLELIEKGLVPLKTETKPKVVVIGAGCAGLCVAYELTRAGFDVSILEAATKVGGRVKTVREPFVEGLHAEAGAMRLPGSHFLVHGYLNKFKMSEKLESFEQKNKLIYLTDIGEMITYDTFDKWLKEKNDNVQKMFPNLQENEKGKTIDELWDIAVEPVVTLFKNTYEEESKKTPFAQAVAAAYKAVTDKYDKYTLRSYFSEVAGWSDDCIRLYDWGEPHVVLDNGFIESWKDAFLSSNSQGEEAQMKQLPGGMADFAEAFVTEGKLQENIRYGAQVYQVINQSSGKIRVNFRTPGGHHHEECDYVVFSIPYPAMRSIKVTPPFKREKRVAIQTLRYVPVTKVLLQFKTRWWEKVLKDLNQGSGGGLVTDLAIRYLMFPGEVSQFKDTKRGVIMASYTFGQDATSLGAFPNPVEKAIDDLKDIFGEELIKHTVEIGASQVWPADALAGGAAFAYFGPGEKTRLYNDIIASDWNDKAFFAGEHASWSHGWIQGALESAIRVSNQIRQQFPME